MSITVRVAPGIATEGDMMRFAPKLEMLTISQDTPATLLLDFLRNPALADAHLLIRDAAGDVLGAVLPRTEYELLNAAAALAKSPEHYRRLIDDDEALELSADEEEDAY